MKWIRFIWLLLITICIYSSTIFAQEAEVYKDRIFVDDVGAVKLIGSDLNYKIPIGSCTLQFDDLSGKNEYYRYRIIHCNKDWTKSDLDEIDYLDGFNDEVLRNYAASISTTIPYIHYELTIPNKDIKLLKSGNYIIQVYKDSNDEIIFQKRFLNNENKVNINANVIPCTNVEKLYTHQELEIEANLRGFKIDNPRREVSLEVLQNYSWDHALKNIKPDFIQTDKIKFTNRDVVVFEGVSEFRRVDLSSIRSKGVNVYDIERLPDRSNRVYVKPDKKKNNGLGINNYDLDGIYVIQNLDYNDDASKTSEYNHVVFSLENAAEFDDYDIFLYGELTNWTIEEKFRLTLNEKYNFLMVETLLKQGVYDYCYVAKPKDSDKYSSELIEGNFAETENLYTILMYYRSPSDRFDRLIGVGNLFSGYKRKSN